MSETADKVEAEGQSPRPKSQPKKKKHTVGILLLLLAAGGAAGCFVWAKAQTMVSTDDAFIQSHIYSISSRISGHVQHVMVRDNQYVKKGDLLVELDPTLFKIKVMDAAAQLDMAKNDTSSEYAQVEAAKAAVAADTAKLEQAKIDLTRGKALFANQVIPKDKLDKLATAKKVAISNLKQAKGSLRKTMAHLGLTGHGAKNAQISLRQAQLEQKRLDLSYTKIYAPSNGYVTRKSVEPGNNIQAGQALMAVVPLANAWVTANFKESQLTHVQPGQKVDFTVDTYPGHRFRGVVDSIMAGTGAAFSLLPPENASGNYVKVVQRIPVKIRIDQASDPSHLLRVGMSVEPTILTGLKVSAALKSLNPFYAEKEKGNTFPSTTADTRPLHGLHIAFKQDHQGE